jgi:4-amino-4-deoxy-L-arabinose transferase-like glycosyltransferase
VALYLGVVFVLCKSTGAILYALILAPLVLRATPERQMKVATFLGVLVLLYPALRASELVPTEWLVEQAKAISPERAQSLEFRFDNEEMLLEKARERIAFGWGGHGRRSVYDDELGKEIAVADGHWIIVLGTRGAVGFLEAFGLLVFPIFFARRRFRRLTDDVERRALAGFTLIVAICAFDLLPNGLFSNYVYLLAGALMGMAQQIGKGRDWRTR